MAFTTRGFLQYTLSGDFDTGTLSEAGGALVTPTDLVWNEEGTGSLIANTFETGELYTPPIGATNFVYIGYVDTGANIGRVFIFQQDGGGAILVGSIFDVTSSGMDGSPGDWPDTIDATDIVKSNLAHCFVGGTMIATPQGEVSIEELSLGDLVLTNEGRIVPIKWIGRQHVHWPTIMSINLEPVLFTAGALGSDMPDRDLFISADHGLLLDGFIVNASALVNGSTIRFANLKDPFVYYHIETENHDVLVANGVPVESFIDYGSRKNFDNFQEYIDLFGAESIIREMPVQRISSQRMLPPKTRARIEPNEACFAGLEKLCRGLIPFFG
jgi:hypothetical protein